MTLLLVPRSPSKFKNLTLDPSAKKTPKPCSTAPKHPWLTVQDWKPPPNKTLPCLQFQTAGAGKYKLTAHMGSLSNNTHSSSLYHIPLTISQTSLPSPHPWLSPSSPPLSPSSRSTHLPHQRHRLTFSNFTLLSNTPSPPQLTYHPHPVPPPFPTNHHKALTSHPIPLPSPPPASLPPCPTPFFTHYPPITPIPSHDETLTFSLTTTTLPRHPNLRHPQPPQHWPLFHLASIQPTL